MCTPPRHAAPEGAVQQPDKLRGGAAAATGGKEVQLPVGLHLHGKQLGGDVVAAAVGTGQTGVGLYEHREIPRHCLRKALRHGEDLLGTQGAVDAHGICPQTPGGDPKAFYGAAGKGASPHLKAHACQHRQGAVLLGGKQRRLQLIQVRKGLKKDQVRPCRHAGTDDAPVLCNGVLKGKGAVGLQQLSQRSHIQRRQRPVGGAGTPAVFDAGGDDCRGCPPACAPRHQRYWR